MSFEEEQTANLETTDPTQKRPENRPRQGGQPTVSDEQGLRIFVLDTNVLMHDPTAIFRFDEHDIVLPMMVLEELDGHKNAERWYPGL